MADDNSRRGLASADEKTRERVAREGGEARKSQGANYSELGRKGGRSQGKQSNPGNFANRPQEEVEEAARKGGQS
ncbi:MAG: KGG domain-containing protein [Candidatus Levybacteria bacterium]|nr:KGG domain-containing protein [Candidatus Levybacteria bacterium]